MASDSLGLMDTLNILSAQLLELWQATIRVMPSFVISLLVFLIFFFLAKPFSALLVHPIGYISTSNLVQNVVRRAISLFIILIGLYIFLSIVGLTQAALAIVSGTGLLGIIIGFAFKDIAENFISSLLLSVQRPFLIGDVIEVQGLKGVVNKVTARGTTLVDFDGNHIQIPNATIYKNVIKNFSANPWVRGSFIVGIGYDASIQQSRQTILAVLNEQNEVLKDPEPQVLIDSLGSSTINIVINFWVDGHQYALNKVASVLMHKTVRRLESAGINMPDDAREVIFPQGIPVVQVNPQQSMMAKAVDKPPVQNDSAEVSTQQLTSDTQDIIDQARNARDPEEGKNII
ncbi:small-conductance mechanosensitive channel [Methylophaga aminisulfidivorans MP]|uniref:Small-conductance mechanosensitive channel n=1 Tax=Methylophaga aminisulfidivorans MP TaxID=1026882 RepID=F5SXD6_9GAMM|nr:mechanosensitive ion channel family protein [Methylophaga aminisulfidivorans]EGL55068.1 small-conductance mechanosensitive channel [Methylophaga aminisulfidivorans MP]